MKVTKTRKSLFAISVLLAPWSFATMAQESDVVAEPEFSIEVPEEEIEEVVVTGRFIDSSQKLVNERMNDAFAADLLGADTISRLGDSTVADALRRVPGLTLVQDKYVYIRGLGERYSQNTLNGAQIPSPDLTRNVIPLNVFPTSIVESLRVQKAWSADLPANFGGGAVDIRTTGIPEGFVFDFEVGVGQNSENPSSVNSYKGGGDDSFGTDDGTRALSSEVINGVASYQGNPSVNSILSFMQRQNSGASLYDAQLENRMLALELNRDIGLSKESTHPDYSFRANVGNKFDIGDDWQAGFSLGGSYDTDWRYTRTSTASFGRPAEENGVRETSTNNVNIAGTLNLGLNWTADHQIETTSLFLRNTDDNTEVYDFFNENRPKSSGRGFRDYRLKFEEREMITHQIQGRHYVGAETKERIALVDKLLGWLPEEAHFDWFLSTSEAQTGIPNEVTVASETFTDRVTGAVLSENVRLLSSAADYRFTDLDDEVDHWGWSAMVPVTTGSSHFEFSGGWNHAEKTRTYQQSQFSLGYLEVSDPSILVGGLDEVFSDDRIMATVPDPTSPVAGAQEFVNNAVFDRQGANTNSYIAATMTDSVFAQGDWTWRDTWRLAAGVRWEDYRQVAVDWNPWGFSPDDPQVTQDPEVLEEGVFAEDQLYPSVGITYMSDFWADTFQLRLNYSETAIRPDLREITDSGYIDPITDDLVRGNPGVVPSDVENLDLRAEWFFSNGDLFSVTLFKKEITNPIEFFEIPASDTTIAREIINAEYAEVEGVEFELVKELSFLGGFFDTLFVQGNLTLQDSELVAGPNANVPTNPVRKLTGASDYVGNLMLGYDSPNTKHTASVIYNVFDERLYVAGRNGSPDGYEQPFHSLDFTYFWYPTDRMTFKVKMQNLLGETVRIERNGAIVFEEDPGTLYALSFSWSM